MPRVEILPQKGHYFLWITENGQSDCWMYDLQEEVKEQKQIANQAFGDVLVAGYGLGVVQKFLLDNPNVTSVLSIEIEPDVIKACKETFGKLFGDILLSDFYQFESRRKFDCVIGDIWKEITPEEEDLGSYVRFKEKAVGLLKEGGKILAWGQDYFEFKLSQNRSD